MKFHDPFWFQNYNRSLAPLEERETYQFTLPPGNYNPSIVYQASRTFDQSLTRDELREREFISFWDEPNFGPDTSNHIAYILLIHRLIEEYKATGDFHTSESEKRILYLFSPNLFPTDDTLRFQVYIPSEDIVYEDVEAEILILYSHHLFNLEVPEEKQFLWELHKGFYSQIW